MEEFTMNKFEELMNKGQAETITQEQIHNALVETIKGFESLKDLNDFLTKLHPSDAYKAVRDIVQPNSNFIVICERKEGTEEYKRFQDIQRESKRIFDYECKTATIFDVQQISLKNAQAVTQQIYGILLRMINKLDDELGKVESAINTIEEHNGLGVTNFNEEVNNNDTTEHGNEQGSEEASN
jgi:hypothetical protein